MQTLEIISVIVLSYLLGSCPYGFIFVKLFAKKDIRSIGSKNIGATNVLRAGYPNLALITLLCDSLKGVASVLISHYFLSNYISVELSTSLAAIFSVIGHIFPVWLKFKGGKGVATTFGTIISLDPILGFISLLAWLTSALITKYSSLSAIISLFILPILCIFLDHRYTVATIIIGLLTIYKHKENIVRLINRTETKINLKKNKNKK